jgi:hypothetical protein
MLASVQPTIKDDLDEDHLGQGNHQVSHQGRHQVSHQDKQARVTKYMEDYWGTPFDPSHDSLLETLYFIDDDCCIDVAETNDWTEFNCRVCARQYKINPKMKSQAVLEHCSTAKHVAAALGLDMQQAKEWHHIHVHPYVGRTASARYLHKRKRTGTPGTTQRVAKQHRGTARNGRSKSNATETEPCAQWQQGNVARQFMESILLNEEEPLGNGHVPQEHMASLLSLHKQAQTLSAARKSR